MAGGAVVENNRRDVLGKIQLRPFRRDPFGVDACRHDVGADRDDGGRLLLRSADQGRLQKALALLRRDKDEAVAGQDIRHHREIAQLVERGPFVQGDGDAALARHQPRRHQRGARYEAVAPAFDRQLEMHDAVAAQLLGDGPDEGGRTFRLDRPDRDEARP